METETFIAASYDLMVNVRGLSADCKCRPRAAIAISASTFLVEIPAKRGPRSPGTLIESLGGFRRCVSGLCAIISAARLSMITSPLRSSDWSARYAIFDGSISRTGAVAKHQGHDIVRNRCRHSA